MVAALQVALHEQPVGGAGTSVWAGIVDDLDENNLTRGERWRGEPGVLGEAQKMLTDPHVRAARDVLVDPVAAAEYDFEPGAGTPRALEIADYCRHVLLERIPWRRHVGDTLRGYTKDGFAIVEKTEAIAPISQTRFPLHPMGGQGVVISGLYYRPGSSIAAWRQREGNAGQLRAVTQYLSGSDVERAGFVDIPSDRFIRFTWEQEGADFEGHAPQRSSWGPWYVKRLLTKLEAMGHERNHIAMPLARPIDMGAGSDDDDKKLSKALSNWRAHEKGHAILPFGYELIWSQHGQQTNIAATIARCNFDIAHNYLSGFMLLGTNATGSYALAGTQKGQYDLSLGKHADFLCDVHNFGLDGWSIVERIVRLNYGPDAEIPRLVVRYLPTVDWEKVLPQLATMVEKKIITRDKRLELFARRGLKAPAPEPETVVDKDPREASENIGAGADIASQLPNGAQVQAAVGILKDVAAQLISRESGRAALVQFYGVAPTVADSLLGPEDFVPAASSAPSSAMPDAAAPARDEGEETSP